VATKTSPARTGSVWTQMPFMHGPTGAARLREIGPVLKAASDQCANRKQRVKRHPWAVQRVQQVLRLQRYDQWNGWIAPATDSGGRRNDGIRDELLAVLREVAAAEAEEMGRVDA